MSSPEAMLPPLCGTHGVFIMIDGQGCWIKGEPGSGKSRLALWLIQHAKAALVADDLVLFRRKKHKIYGQGLKHMRGIMHVHGLGFLDIVALAGRKALVFEAPWRITIEMSDASCHLKRPVRVR